MPIKLTFTLPSYGVQPTLTATLGITPERKQQLEFQINLICQKSKGSFLDDFQTIARECETQEEYTFAIFQYGVTVGTNMAMSAAISQKN